MSEYAAILGHEPTERTRKAIDRLEALAHRLHAEAPELNQRQIWEIIDHAATRAILNRRK